MKLIFAGSRDGPTLAEACLAYHQWPGEKITEIVSGGARGADALGERIAVVEGIPLTIMKAKWDELGKRAGYVRNTEMAEYADALLALWDGESKGTKHMIDTMKGLGKPVHIYYV